MTSGLLSIVFAREYLKIVRKKSFWASTLLLPILFLVLTILSGASNKELKQTVNLSSVKNETIALVDPGDHILQAYKDARPFVTVPSAADAIAGVKSAKYDAAFVYPADVEQTKAVAVYAHDLSIIRRNRYDGLAKGLLQQSVLQGLGSADKIQIAGGNIATDTTVYEHGVLAPKATSYILPAALGVAFFMLVILSSSYLILALSEEKENRIIEIVSTIVPTRTLLVGKITALVAVGLTQVVAVLLLGIAVAIVLSKNLPVSLDLAQLTINAPQLLLGALFVILGYLLLAITMSCVGILMPSAREAASFSGFFIFLSVCPIYFQGTLLTNPNGQLAYVLSYFPLTATPTLLLRNALNAIPLWEVPLSILALLVYIWLVARLAEFLYRFAGIEYQDRVSLRQILANLRG